MSNWRPTTTLLEALTIQRRVLGALLMREAITRFGRENVGILWLVGEPMIFTLGVAALWTAAGLDHGSSMPIVAFAVTGYSSVLLWRNSVNRCNGGVHQNRNLLYHRNVRLLDVFLTRIALEVVGATASFIALVLVFIGVEWIEPPRDLFLVCAGWLMLIWFGAALAILMGSLTAYNEVIERIWHPASYLIFPLSGAAFMVDWLHADLQRFVLMLPMVHGLEMLREGYFGGVVRPHYDAVYMASINGVLTLCGLFVLRDASRRLN